ncbi:MAG: hypothetical protein K2I36_00250 [Ureaplasma sp.]|nr:hypothetical protein [Ureaplasma sp.]MDE7221816.1 hypothetical protein [Ureaplasma sp.]
MKNNKFTEIVKINQKDALAFGLEKDLTQKLIIDNKTVDIFWFDECLFVNNLPIQNIKNLVQNELNLDREKLLKFTRPTSNKSSNFKRIITSSTLKNNNL